MYYHHKEDSAKQSKHHIEIEGDLYDISNLIPDASIKFCQGESVERKIPFDTPYKHLIDELLIAEDDYQRLDAVSSSQQPSQDMLEISPGVSVPYRGFHEAVKAAKSGNFTLVSCLNCSEMRVCASDAEYVICPSCHFVSPRNQQYSFSDRLHPRRSYHGVCLGLPRECIGI